MRIKLNTVPHSSEYGMKRYINKFLCFPKVINHELRWLERVMYEQVVDYRLVQNKDIYIDYYKKFYWRDTKWVDLPELVR